MSLEDIKKRTVLDPDGKEIEIDPLKDYYCATTPDMKMEHHKSSAQVIEKFANWARSESLWILAFGTGCGAIPPEWACTPVYPHRGCLPGLPGLQR